VVLQDIEFVGKFALQWERDTALLPEHCHIAAPRSVGAPGDIAGLLLGISDDDVTRHADARKCLRRPSERRPFVMELLDERAHHRRRAKERDEVDIILGGPRNSLRPRDAVPQRRVRKLRRL
jgi:hypothetical protein